MQSNENIHFSVFLTNDDGLVERLLLNYFWPNIIDTDYLAACERTIWWISFLTLFPLPYFVSIWLSLSLSHSCCSTLLLCIIFFSIFFLFSVFPCFKTNVLSLFLFFVDQDLKYFWEIFSACRFLILSFDSFFGKKRPKVFLIFFFSCHLFNKHE